VGGCKSATKKKQPPELNIIGDYEHAIFERDSQMVVEGIHSHIVGVSRV
jgi:hypothetical protein